MKRIIFIFWLLVSPVLSTAQIVFEPPVIIDPPNPQVGDVIRVGLFTTFFPPCLLLPWENEQGETHLFDFDSSLPGYEENHIDLIVVTMTQPICNPLPVSPAPREYYELGVLEEGDYSLQTGWVDSSIPLPPPLNITPFRYGEILTFSVTRPVSIYSTSTYGLVTLAMLVLALALFHLRKEGA